MKASEIARIKFHAQEVELPSDDMLVNIPSVRDEAAELLGYQAKTTPSKTARDSEEGPLARALREAEIEILNWVDVKKYQLEKRHQAEKAELQRRHAAGEQDRFRTAITWDEKKLSEYKGFVPDFVLNKAIELKRRIPEVEFGVVELTRHTDPFLVAYIGGAYEWQRKEQFYIEVWDEAAFEGREE